MAAETRKSRKSNFSQDEIDVLITTVMQNHNILYGETSKSFFHKEIRNQVWNIILEEVNKVSLERRTLNEVKNKWKKCQYSLRAADHVETVDYVDVDDLDSMPLQQRLSQNHNEPPPLTPIQEPVLQSQPISPTKLKVTRQGAKPHQPPAKPPTPLPQNPEVCLRWNSHHTNMQSTFPSLLTKEQYVDATLVSEGKTLKCHRMILSSCSPYFEQVLEGIGPFQHPVIFMKDIPFWILKALCDFMYAGEVHIYQEKLQELLNVAEALKIKGLAGNADTKEDVKPVITEIKQEVDVTPPPKILERPLKEEKEEDLPLSSKVARHDAMRPSKKREDKKSKHAAQLPKEKVGEELPAKVVPKTNPKVVLPKMTAKVVLSKVVLPRVQSTPKTTVKNVMKNVLQKVPKPSTSKAAHASRKSDTSRKSEKHKADVITHKEKEKEKDKSPLKKDNINDPLDLLQPVYEEIAKEDPPHMLKCINPAKLKERGNIPMRKGVNKKVKKRRYAEYAEERDESPPPVFPARKGTRSRPHVKIPKFFHTHYEDTQKETTDATIVREPHTDQNDPLIGLEEVDEIKAEPLDVEENTIEMEENLENYMQDQEMISQEGEEIIGNYDSPIVNIKREVIKRNTPNIFKKMLDPQPVIMNIHTVTEEHPQEVRLLNLHENTLKIVDISKISAGQNRLEETIIGTNSFDTMVNTQESEIMISNVQSMAETCEDSRSKESEERLQRNDSSMRTEENPIRTVLYHHQIDPNLRLTTNSSENEVKPMETNQVAFRIKVETVHNENSQDCDEFAHRQVENETDLRKTEITHLNVPEQESAVAGASLDSLEVRLGACDIESQHLESEEIGDRVVKDCSDTVGKSQNETDKDVEEEQPTDKALTVNIDQLQNPTPESQSAMSVDSEIKESYEGNCDTTLENYQNTVAATETSLDSEIDNRKTDKGQGIDTSIETTEQDGLSGYGLEDTQQLDENKETNVDSGIEGYSVEPINYADEPVQRAAVDSEEIMSVGTVSQEAMSIGIGSQEIEASVQNTAENIPNSDYNLENSSQDPLQNLGEIETVQNVEQANLTEQDSRDVYEDNLQRTVGEEDAANQITRDNTENTPEMMSLGIQSQNTEQDTYEPALPLQESVEENRTESVGVRYVNNGCEGTTNREELEKRVFDEAAQSENTDFVVGNTKDSALAEERDIEREENIEDELEECLASTSTIAPVPSVEKLKPGTGALSFDEDEDFTKDIEFDTFIGRNRPTNYLGDEFNEDFEMRDVERPISEDRLMESEDRNIGGGDTEAISDRTGGNDDSDRGVVNEDRLAESDNKEVSCEYIGDNIVRTDDEWNREENISQNHDAMERLDKNTVDDGHNVNLNDNVIPTNDDQNISETTEYRDSIEDEKKLEDSLLADVDDDDDVEMSEASTSKKTDDEDRAEKTLEMIVNDLNESLGELKK